MIDFDHKISDLDVYLASRAGGQLRRRSQFEFEYLPAAAGPVSLLMPAITSAMHETLAAAPKDSRVPRSTLRAMKLEWEESVQRFS